MESMDSNTEETTLLEVLAALRPWLNQDQVFLIELAKHQWNARLVLAAVLLESNKYTEAVLLLQSIIEAPKSDLPEQESYRTHALLELGSIRMEQLRYDEAEDLLWKARELYSADQDMDYSREDISLLIAQCRFGQGFVQDAIDRATEIIHKLQSLDAGGTRMAKAYQQLGWFYMHKMDVPNALFNMKKAMKLAPDLDRELVDAGLEAEGAGNYEKALENYFDSLLFDS